MGEPSCCIPWRLQEPLQLPCCLLPMSHRGNKKFNKPYGQGSAKQYDTPFGGGRGEGTGKQAYLEILFVAVYIGGPAIVITVEPALLRSPSPI